MKRIILTCVAVIFAATQLASGAEFQREITKEFTVGANPNLHIENKYGNIRMVEGTDNQIIFQITITAKASKADLAKEYAESVSIDFNQFGDRVSAKTNYKSIKCNNCSRTTHYTVIVPKGVTLNLDNIYGNIYIDNADKPLTVDLKYGNLDANTLENVALNIKYGNASIRSCNDINLNTAYSKFKISKAGKMAVSSKYDEFQLGEITDVLITSGYTNVKVDKIEKSFVCHELKYGSLDIKEISAQFTAIKVKASYSTVKLALDNRHSFSANLNARYGSIKTGNMSFTTVSRNKESNTESLSGTVGSNPSAIVDVSASYGNIVLN